MGSAKIPTGPVVQVNVQIPPLERFRGIAEYRFGLACQPGALSRASW